MSNEPTADEQPKRKIAHKVIAQKRRYFEPHRDYVAEEVERQKAQAGADDKQLTQEEEGDG